MDQIQLRMKPGDVSKVIDSINRDLDANPDNPDATALTGIVSWLNYRVTRAATPPPAKPQG